MLKIRKFETNEVADLHRDVAAKHPEWVHTQLGTSSESELQGLLDSCSLDEFAQNPEHEDATGVFMATEDAAEYLDNE